MKILGHAGMGIESNYPLNSEKSIKRALELGADGSEMDVQMTSDSVLVAFHHHDLSEDTNLDGLVNSHAWAEIKKGHFSFGLHKRLSIVSLEELFAGIGDLHEHIFTLDCKLYTQNDSAHFQRSFARALAELISRYELGDKVNIEAPYEEFLEELRKKSGSLNLFVYAYDFNEAYSSAIRKNLSGITISNDLIDSEQVQKAQEHGLKVAIWDVDNNKENLQALQKKPDYIQTDELKSLIRIKKR